MALAFAQGLPRTTTCVVRSAEGLSRIGFMSTSGSTIAAPAWEAWARPISAPSRVTKELRAMFWALNGATLAPSRASQRQMARRARARAARQRRRPGPRRPSDGVARYRHRVLRAFLQRARRGGLRGARGRRA